MRVNVNGRYLLQRVTGVQRYAREIVARLADRCEVIRPAPSVRGLAGQLWEQLILPIRKGRGLLWSPSNTGPLAVREQVVTVHDCAVFDHAECFSRAFAVLHQQLVPRLARRVRLLITVSEFSKARILAHCRVPAERVKVIANGVDSRFVPQAAPAVMEAIERLRLPKDYVLCVGSLEPRKNLGRLLEAWRRVQTQVEGLSLVLAGGSHHVFRDAGLDELTHGVHLAGYVDDDLLPAIYSGARAFVYPSLYEGFGLPILEAMACGTPVICSNTTALPETAGDAARLVDPLAPESIAEGILEVVRSEAWQRDLRQRGLARARQFTWDRTAEETWHSLTRAGDTTCAL